MSTSSNALTTYAGALVRGPGNLILCQLRDDKPGLPFAGLWTCLPGGKVEAHETPREAMERELAEEFAIEVDEVRPAVIWKFESGTAPGIYHIFLASLITTPDKIACYEGQRAELVELERAMELPQHPVSYNFLVAYERGELDG